MPATPLSYWIGFHIALIVLMGADLVFARRQHRLGRTPHSAAIPLTILWVLAALALAGFVYHQMGSKSAVEYITGYALEESLSIDNLFVFLLLFRAFDIEQTHQPKVLFWGVGGAIVMRGAFVAGGIQLLNHFEFVTYIFAIILLVAAARIAIPSKSEESGEPPLWLAWLRRIHPVSMRQDRFTAVEDGHRRITVLLIALIAIELTDIVFALDSIPAVLSITRHPFLAYTSNIMAVMGLRSLYFLLIGMLSRLRFLHYGLAAVLAFAATKMLASRWIEIDPLVSLLVIVLVLGATLAVSLLRPHQQKD